MSNAGTVSVKFTVANAETVRQALASLGKDGEKALKQFDTSAQPASRSMLGLSDVVDMVRNRALGLASAGGTVGSVLTRWGPLGVVAGASLGVAALAISKLNGLSEEYYQKLRKIDDARQTLQMTAGEVQTLGRAAAESGMDFDEVTKAMGRFTVSMDDVRRGEGEFFKALQRVDPELARQLAATKDNAAAWDLLAKNLDRFGTSRNAILRGGFGNAGPEMAGPMDVLNRRGGLIASTAADNAAFKNTAQDQIDTLKKLRLEAEQTSSAVSGAIGRMWTDAMVDARAKALELLEPLIEWFKTTRAFQAFNPPRPHVVVTPDPENKPDPSLTPEFRLNEYRKEVALLGQAITPTEELKLKKLELAVATQNYTVNVGAANRGLAAFQAAQDKTAASIREKLGVISQEEMLRVRLKELDDLQAKGMIRTAEERAAAERLVTREVEEQYKALQVRNSVTPQLTKLSQDAGDLTAQLDSGLAGALRSVSSEFSLFSEKTETASQRALNFGKRLADMAMQAVAMKTIIGPIASGISGMFNPTGPGNPFPIPIGSPVGSARGNVFGANGLYRFGRGGAFTNSIVTRPTLFSFARGGALGEMGEAGPEAIMPLRRRNGVLGVDASGARSPRVIINNNGAPLEVEREVEHDDGTTELFVRNVARDEQFSGRSDRPMRQKYGLKPRLNQRRG